VVASVNARAYLRASTDGQHASRSTNSRRISLSTFTLKPSPWPRTKEDYGLTIVGWFIENESGASLQRPELFRLLRDSQSNDVLLCEQVDRLSRLTDRL
jgi:DNA invertase Pin-like site-specific DNA recombinase